MTADEGTVGGPVAPGDAPPGMTVAQLAERSGVSVRNIREYQDRDLLAAPRRSGRIALYDDDHLVRLRLITRLLRRGYPMAVIRDLVDAWSAGRDLHDVLGLELAASRPWSEEEPGRAGRAQLARRFGDELTPDVLDRLVALGLLVPARGGYEVPSPRLLDAAEELLAAGIPLGAVLDVLERVRADLDAPADRLVGLVVEHVLPEASPGGMPVGAELARAGISVDRLRPHAQGAVQALFARAMERAVDDAVDRIAGRALGAAPRAVTPASRSSDPPARR